MRYGIQGFLGGRSVELSRSFGDPRDLELLRNTPSSWLGSCRYKLPDPADDEATYQRLFERFRELGAAAVLYIGGNDSMDTIAKLGAYGREYGSDIRFIGVPKTIDNDLVQTDHTPGYGSAARFVATAMREIACDADVYDLKSVTFVEIMGRDAGWLAAASALANPDIVLLPEAPARRGRAAGAHLRAAGAEEHRDGGRERGRAHAGRTAGLRGRRNGGGRGCRRVRSPRHPLRGRTLPRRAREGAPPLQDARCRALHAAALRELRGQRGRPRRGLRAGPRGSTCRACGRDPPRCARSSA